MRWKKYMLLIVGGAICLLLAIASIVFLIKLNATRRSVESDLSSTTSRLEQLHEIPWSRFSRFAFPGRPMKRIAACRETQPKPRHVQSTFRRSVLNALPPTRRNGFVKAMKCRRPSNSASKTENCKSCMPS